MNTISFNVLTYNKKVFLLQTLYGIDDNRIFLPSPGQGSTISSWLPLVDTKKIADTRTDQTTTTRPFNMISNWEFIGDQTWALYMSWDFMSE